MATKSTTTSMSREERIQAARAQYAARASTLAAGPKGPDVNAEKAMARLDALSMIHDVYPNAPTTIKIVIGDTEVVLYPHICATGTLEYLASGTKISVNGDRYQGNIQLFVPKK